MGVPPPLSVPSPPWPNRPPERAGGLDRPAPRRPWGTILGGVAVALAVGATAVVAAVSLVSPAHHEPTTSSTVDEAILPDAQVGLPGADAADAAEEGGTAATTGPATPEEWAPEVADLAAYVEQARGLAFDHPVAVEFLSPEAFSEQARATAGLELDPGAETDYLEGFGLLDGDLDLAAVEADLADAGTVGFYDYVEDRIVVRGTEMTPDVQGTIVHELTHALQAQHFDAESGSQTPDGLAAHLGVEEGDAMRVEIDWYTTLGPDEQEAYSQALDELTTEYEAKAATLPEILAARDMGPYTLGPQLVDVLAADGGNAAVDEALTTPPDSTEQLLDPRAFLDRQPPATVAEPVLPGGASARGEPFTLGAFELYLVLATRLGPVGALDAVTGWGGDTTVAYQRGDRRCVAVAAQGDTASDSAEIAAAFGAWVAAGPPRGARVADGPGDAATLLSCETNVTADSGAMTTSPDAAMALLDSRALLTWEAMELDGDAAEDALAQSDCLVHAVPLDELTTMLGASETPEADAALQDAKAACGG